MLCWSTVHLALLAGAVSARPVHFYKYARRATLDTGSCGSPEIEFANGLDGRNQPAFQPVNQAEYVIFRRMAIDLPNDNSSNKVSTMEARLTLELFRALSANNFRINAKLVKTLWILVPTHKLLPQKLRVVPLLTLCKFWDTWSIGSTWFFPSHQQYCFWNWSKSKHQGI